MNRSDYIFYMKNFLESSEFKGRHIVEDNGVYYDENNPKHIYFKRINSTRNIDPPIEKYDADDTIIPVIYISDKPRVIHLIGGNKYNSKSWSLDRMNDMQGFEYDYAYLHQCQILGRQPFCHWTK